MWLWTGGGGGWGYDLFFRNPPFMGFALGAKAHKAKPMIRKLSFKVLEVGYGRRKCRGA